MMQARKAGLEARLASSEAEITAAQKLRYMVFYQELLAKPTKETRASQLDQDAHDALCDHVIVVSKTIISSSPILIDGGELVGTYRLLPQQRVDEKIRFYSQNEFDIEALIASRPHQKFLELGRSCIRHEFRDKPVLALLWQFIWNYVRQNDVDVVFGCASLIGTSILQARSTLMFLTKNFQAPEQWQVSARKSSHVAVYADHTSKFDRQRAVEQEAITFHQLPRLLKSYLKIGAYVSNQAVIDRQFNTIDILVILPILNINKKYFTRFGAPNQEA